MKRKKKRIGSEFLAYHNPDALKFLTLHKVTNQSYNDIFYYEQLVMDLPLENAGCRIVIDHLGDVTGFTYRGVKDIPEIPETLIAKEKLVAHVTERLDFQLQVVRQQETGDFRLVYEPTIECMNYKAGVMDPTFAIIHDEEIEPTFISLPTPENGPKKGFLSTEEIIGISEEMEVIREKEMGREKGIVWRWKNWEEKENNLTLNAFFANHNDDTVKAFIHKETGEVTRFMWFYKRKGELQLTREECFAKATDFLQKMIPEYYTYLQWMVINEEPEEEPSMSSFTFWFHNGQGIPVHSEIIMVSVNPTTGQIDHYNGPTFKIEQLEQIPTEPKISKEEARERFLQQMDFKLVWHYDYDTESYFLSYEACHRETQSSIQNIDAMTGEVITYHDFF